MNEAVGEAAAVGERAISGAGQQIELAIVLVLLLLVVALVVGVIWRYIRTTPADRFVTALADRDRVAVLMHPNPDPDAMASAMAVAELAEAVDTEAPIQYPGQIRHPENRAFQTVLECDFEHVERADELAASHVVLVDHNEPRGFAGAEDIVPYAVVDHHPGDGEGTAFTDVRPSRGSCAGIFAEYFRQRGWGNAPGSNKRIPSTLATALLYGIQSDTASFTRGCTHAEFDAAAFLFPAADSDALERIANPQVDSETLEVKAKAITERHVDRSFLISHVGDISNRDALPAAADELVRLEGVTVAVVTGERDGCLHLSGRSQDDRVHMGRTLASALESITEASGGGHARMGAGQMPLSTAASKRDGHPDLDERLFAAMDGDL
jgi:nanoRNase/pAp phosphatase (c-di-AMP/oligoRNAs hydrolase)